VELQGEYQRFRAAGAEIVALAYQDVSRALLMSQLVSPSYPILADADHAVSDAYAVFDLLGDGVATPSVFVVDRDGVLVWSYVCKTAEDRPSADDIFAHLPK